MPIDPTCPLDPRDAGRRIKAALLGGGEVGLAKHFRDRLKKWGLTMLDIEQVVRTGVVRMPGEPHPKTGNIVYRVEGRTVDDRRIVVCVVLQSEREITLVTVFDEERGG